MSDLTTDPEHRLPSRDFVILPILSLLTILFLLFGSEVGARLFFPEQKKDECEIADARIGFRYKAGCTTKVKAAEGPWVLNQYNDCGYRTNESCGPKRSGTTRIALVGSSIAEGWLVSYDQSFAVRTATNLTTRCGRPVEVENLGRQSCSPTCVSRRVDEALALKPDLLLITINPSDIEGLTPTAMAARLLPAEPVKNDEPMAVNPGFVRGIRHRIADSRAVTMAEHYVYQDPSTYLRLALINPDATGFLRTPFNPAWEQRFSYLDTVLGEMQAKAHAAGVPLVLVEIPSAAQAAALSLGKPPAQVDPNALNDRLAVLAAKNGIQFVDVLKTFQQTPGSNKMYYLADGHLNGEGQALVSDPLADQLSHGPNSSALGCSGTTQARLDEAARP